MLSHTAMKEIEAISKLCHNNIVGYKGCWVEAEEPNRQRLDKIICKVLKRERKTKEKLINLTTNKPI